MSTYKEKQTNKSDEHSIRCEWEAVFKYETDFNKYFMS